MSKRLWLLGDPVPMFVARSTNNPRFNFDTAAGRYVVICFFGSALVENHRKAIEHITAKPNFFNDETACFFGVSIDTNDEALERVKQVLPGIRYFWDFDGEVSKLYGAIEEKGEIKPEGQLTYYPFTLILDPMLRVLGYIPLNDLEQHNRAFDYIFSRLPELQQHASVPLNAPVLVLPRVFEPEFCRELIDIYIKNGGQESGFMREIDGKTVAVLDNTFKRRADFDLDRDETYDSVCKAVRARFSRRLIPEIYKAFQFQVTRIERYLVARYDSESGGFFRPHRDNTTKGTAHRCFACTINLNAEEYEGGNLRFPEFGSQTYRAPTGGAVVFSCSLLHEATPVIKGRRYAFLPFFYNEASAKIRQQNISFLTGQTIDKNKGEEEILTSSAP
jgi:predicted 2-oxoglutarate/Fe(II)-dependent dioxygenase YbiX/peroxiredoxin